MNKLILIAFLVFLFGGVAVQELNEYNLRRLDGNDGSTITTDPTANATVINDSG